MLDRTALEQAILKHGQVARLVVAAHEGSSPRENGAAMLVWENGQSGTIGGGALEWNAICRARRMLSQAPAKKEIRRLDRDALGPSLGQCCGGTVSLLTEIWDAERLKDIPQSGVFIRQIAAHSPQIPLVLRRFIADARAKGTLAEPALIQGWMVEPLLARGQSLWIWGAGHVGRALVNVLSDLPQFAITWVDISASRFPADIPKNVTQLWAENPALLVSHAPKNTLHLVVTYSHALDLELCHRILGRGFDWLGLIGSDTKRARFRSRLAHLGHEAAQIQRICCPIGDPSLGKHPQAIALGVGVQLIKVEHHSGTETTDDWHGNGNGNGDRIPSTAGGADEGLSGSGRQ